MHESMKAKSEKSFSSATYDEGKEERKVQSLAT